MRAWSDSRSRMTAVPAASPFSGGSGIGFDSVVIGGPPGGVAVGRHSKDDGESRHHGYGDPRLRLRLRFFRRGLSREEVLQLVEKTLPLRRNMLMVDLGQFAKQFLLAI